MSEGKKFVHPEGGEVFVTRKAAEEGLKAAGWVEAGKKEAPAAKPKESKKVKK